MDTPAVKKVVDAKIVKAKKKGTKLEGAAMKEFNKVKKVVDAKITKAKKKGTEIEGVAMKEFAKIQKEMEATSKKVAAYIKKNPEKAAIISAGIGVALGAVAGIFLGNEKGKGKKKK